MIRLLWAWRAKIVQTVRTSHSALGHVFSSLSRENITFIIFLFIVNLSRSHLKDVAAFALDHRILFTKVNVHSNFFDLSFVISPKNLFDFNLRNNFIAFQTSRVFKFGICILRPFVPLTYFACILFETTYVVLMKALCLHEHPDVLCFLIFRQDLAITVLANGFFSIRNKSETFFFLFFRHVNILILREWFFHRHILNYLGIL